MYISGRFYIKNKGTKSMIKRNLLILLALLNLSTALNATFQEDLERFSQIIHDIRDVTSQGPENMANKLKELKLLFEHLKSYREKFQLRYEENTHLSLDEWTEGSQLLEASGNIIKYLDRILNVDLQDLFYKLLEHSLEQEARSGSRLPSSTYFTHKMARRNLRYFAEQIRTNDYPETRQQCFEIMNVILQIYHNLPIDMAYSRLNLGNILINSKPWCSDVTRENLDIGAIPNEILDQFPMFRIGSSQG